MLDYAIHSKKAVLKAEESRMAKKKSKPAKKQKTGPKEERSRDEMDSSETPSTNAEPTKVGQLTVLVKRGSHLGQRAQITDVAQHRLKTTETEG